MRDAKRFKLLHGPYPSPRVRAGDTLFCEVRGTVRTGGYTSAPIPWPRLLKAGKHSPIVTAELARAVRTESVIAIAHRWGVSTTTVWAWRQALGVPQINEGTRRLYRDYVGAKLPDDIAAEGRERALLPSSRAKIGESKRGRKAHPSTAAALRRSASRRKPKRHGAAIGNALKLYWLKSVRAIPSELVRAVVEYRKVAPTPGRGTQWHSTEESLLGLGPDRVIAGILGRSKASVSLHRQSRGIARYMPASGLSPKRDAMIAAIASGEPTLSDEQVRELFPDIFSAEDPGHAPLPRKD